MIIKSIETNYNGILFRSKLEAKWAYLLDCFCIDYEYEPEAFSLSNGVNYLPDFYIPLIDCYIEVKPSFQSDFGHKDNCHPGGWIMKHPDWYTKWKPFAESKRLGFFIGLPGEYMVLIVDPKTIMYDFFTCQHDIEFHRLQSDSAVAAARNARFFPTEPKRVMPGSNK